MAVVAVAVEVDVAEPLGTSRVELLAWASAKAPVAVDVAVAFALGESDSAIDCALAMPLAVAVDVAVEFLLAVDVASLPALLAVAVAVEPPLAVAVALEPVTELAVAFEPAPVAEARAVPTTTTTGMLLALPLAMAWKQSPWPTRSAEAIRRMCRGVMAIRVV